MFDEAGGLDHVAVVEDELLLLRRELSALAQIASLQRPIHNRHGHGLALAMTKGEAITARELRRRLL